jgi:predicted nucleic acid-binding protein
VGRPIRTFLDSGVLIAAFKGAPRLRETALGILEDSSRILLTSPYVRLEVLPKAMFHKQTAETHFYESFFARAFFARDIRAILALAEREAAVAGVGAMDSLHLAAAHLLKADEFLTTERPSKSIHRSSLVNVVCLFD